MYFVNIYSRGRGRFASTEVHSNENDAYKEALDWIDCDTKYVCTLTDGDMVDFTSDIETAQAESEDYRKQCSPSLGGSL